MLSFFPGAEGALQAGAQEGGEAGASAPKAKVRRIQMGEFLATGRAGVCCKLQTQTSSELCGQCGS